MYARSLLTLRALTDSRTGAVAAGARDGWAYVWPRDAATAALALEAAGYRGEARRVVAFLDGLDLGAGGALRRRRPAGAGPRPAGRRRRLGRGRRPRHRRSPSPPATAPDRRDRPDYQEGRRRPLPRQRDRRRPPDVSSLPHVEPDRRSHGSDAAARGLVRRAGDPGSGLDSAAAWAVRPFPRPALFPAVRRTLLTWPPIRPGSGSLPGEGWSGGVDPWTAPTAWSAWAFAALARTEPHPPPPARPPRSPAPARRPAPRRDPGRGAARAGRRPHRHPPLDHPARLAPRLRDPRPARTLAGRRTQLRRAPAGERVAQRQAALLALARRPGRLSALAGAAASSRRSAAAAAGPPELRSSQPANSRSNGISCSRSSSQPGRLADLAQPLRRQAGPVRGVAQALDLLVPGRRVAVLVGDVVADDHPAAGPHDPRHLLDHPLRSRDVVQAEAGDARRRSSRPRSPSAVASPTENSTLPSPSRAASSRACSIIAGVRSTPWTEPTRPASVRETAAGPQATSSQRARVRRAPARPARPAPRPSASPRRGRRLGLVGELVADRLLVHAPTMLEAWSHPERVRVRPGPSPRPPRPTRPGRRPARPPSRRARPAPSCSRVTTVRPIVRARAISESVPHSPPTAITTSPEPTTARFRAWPMPVATTSVQYGFASSISVPRTIPITRPPASRAPRAAASITPGPAPQTTVTPASPSRRPTSSANRATSDPCSTPLAPITATCRARVRPGDTAASLDRGEGPSTEPPRSS